MEGYKDRLAVAMRAALFYAEMEPDDLARQLGRHVETVRRWTRAETSIPVEDVVEVADALDCPIDLLLRPPKTRQEALRLIAAHRTSRTGP